MLCPIPVFLAGKRGVCLTLVHDKTKYGRSETPETARPGFNFGSVTGQLRSGGGGTSGPTVGVIGMDFSRILWWIQKKPSAISIQRVLLRVPGSVA